MNLSLCNGMHMLSHEEGPDRTVFDGWSTCTRERGHDGHHADNERTWETMFHYDGDVCQICGSGETTPSNPKFKSGNNHWTHRECEDALRQEIMQEWAVR